MQIQWNLDLETLDLEHSLDLELMDLPGFSALPGFKSPFYGNGQSALNPGTTVVDSWRRFLL